VTIVGTFEGFTFSIGLDKLKLLNISTWGDLKLGDNLSDHFHGCANLTITAQDLLNTSGKVSFIGTFRGCSSLTTIPRINEWDLSAGVQFNGFLRDCTSFNQALTLDTPLGEIFTGFIRGSTSLNQPLIIISPLATSYNSLVNGCTAFDQDLSGLDFTNIVTASNMLLDVTLSTANYDSLLIGMEAQSVQNNVPFNGGNSTYSAGAAATARANLIADHTWTITDGGLAP
jgi:surface protein